MIDISTLIVSQLPLGILIIIAVVVMWMRLGDLKHALYDLKKTFRDQVHWCMDHWQPRD